MDAFDDMQAFEPERRAAVLLALVLSWLLESGLFREVKSAVILARAL